MSLSTTFDTVDRDAATGYRAALLPGIDHPFVGQFARHTANVFATRGFLAALFETIGAATDTQPLLVAVSDEVDQPVALLPFTFRRQGGLRLVEGMGLGVSDYYAPPLAAGRVLDSAQTAAMWRSVLKALPSADLVRLYNVPQTLGGKPHALSTARFLGDMGHGSTMLPLTDATGGRLDLSKLSVSRDVRRKQKKLAALGELRFFEATTEEERDALMDALVHFRRDRFAKMGRRDKLDEPGVTAFYRRLASQGLARVYGLSVGGEPVAVVYGLAHDGVFTLIIPTMTADERYESGSPGLVSLYMAIEASIRAGDRVLDFSVGDLFYKSRFSTEKIELLEHVEARSLLGIPAMLAIRGRTTARLWRNRLRSALKRRQG